MTVGDMRAAISNAYRSEKWRRRVEVMQDAQVIATYYRLLNNKQL